MTPRYPGAIWRPSGDNGAMGQMPDVGTLHEAVSPNPTTVFGWVQTTHACHAYNGKNGLMEQYADFDRRVAGVASGNHHCLTIESYDGLRPIDDSSGYREVPQDSDPVYGTSANTGRWDAGQCERAADLIAWCSVVLGTIAAREIPNSIPGQSGWAPHRWGIAPWRVSGGEVWTAHDGKPCPGDLRVAQIPGIVARGQAIAAAVQSGTARWLPAGPVDLATALQRGDGQSPNAGPPVVPTPVQEELTMAQIDDIMAKLDRIDQAVHAQAQGVTGTDGKPSDRVADIAAAGRRASGDQVNKLNEIYGAVTKGKA